MVGAGFPRPPKGVQVFKKIARRKKLRLRFVGDGVLDIPLQEIYFYVNFCNT